MNLGATTARIVSEFGVWQGQPSTSRFYKAVLIKLQDPLLLTEGTCFLLQLYWFVVEGSNLCWLLCRFSQSLPWVLQPCGFVLSVVCLRRRLESCVIFLLCLLRFTSTAIFFCLNLFQHPRYCSQQALSVTPDEQIFRGKDCKFEGKTVGKTYLAIFERAGVVVQV